MRVKGLAIIAASAITLVAGPALAFHSGGVAECEGCHSMHTPAAGGSSLLVGATPSEACLTCHEHAGDTGPSSYHISTASNDMLAADAFPKQRTPGGDFGWLKKVFSYSVTSNGVTTNYAETGGGHNINAPANGYNPASGTAPGGTFPAAELGCNSCHNPHSNLRRDVTGNVTTSGAPIYASGSYPSAANEPKTGGAVGVYRLLAGGARPNVTFAGVPAAKVPSTYNQTEATNQVRVAYGVKVGTNQVAWGSWCSTCHPNMHSTGNYTHPVDQALGATIIGNYNAYKMSGDLTGTSAAAYSNLTPFITNSGDYAALGLLAKNDNTALAGPTDGDQVSCLSCHRAHASGFDHMLRFDYGYEFTTVNGNYVGSDNASVTGSRAPLQHRGRTIAAWQAAFYDRPATQFATYQRVLCNKCHAKD